MLTGFIQSTQHKRDQYKDTIFGVKRKNKAGCILLCFFRKQEKTRPQGSITICTKSEQVGTAIQQRNLE